MKKTHLVVGALILCSNLFAQPKGIDAYEKKFFTKKTLTRTWVKKRTDQVYFFAGEATSFGRLTLLKELKKILIEYDKCFEQPDADFSVGFEDVAYEDVTTIISYLYQGGKEFEYYFLVEDYAINLFLGDDINCISVSKLNKNELLADQKFLEELNQENH
jgi:hypothetical protein